MRSQLELAAKRLPRIFSSIYAFYPSALRELVGPHVTYVVMNKAAARERGERGSGRQRGEERRRIKRREEESQDSRKRARHEKALNISMQIKGE